MLASRHNLIFSWGNASMMRGAQRRIVELSSLIDVTPEWSSCSRLRPNGIYSAKAPVIRPWPSPCFNRILSLAPL